MKISVVTPTWNSFGNIQRCIASVRAASEGLNVEHLIQDGGSTDGTVDWLLQNGQDVISEKDDGMYDAINRAWSRSSGEILCWLNSDEQYLCDTLKHVTQVFIDNPDIDVVTGDYVVVDDNGQAIAARRDIRPIRYLLRAGLMSIATCATFYRRRLWDSGVLRLNDNFRYAADLDLAIRLSKANVRWRKESKYFSLFTFDGRNLSCSPRMLQETEAIVKAESFGLVRRKMASVVRIGLRAIGGCYRKDNLSFQYFDESGALHQCAPGLVGWSYKQR